VNLNARFYKLEISPESQAIPGQETAALVIRK